MRISGYFFCMSRHKTIAQYCFSLCAGAILVINSFTCTACGRSINNSLDKIQKTRLILATSSDPKTFNPIVAQETSSTQILNVMFEGLTTIDPYTGDVVPNIAESWSHDDEGLIWTVRLRQDVQWSDGSPFTAHDVVFTFNDIIYNPDILTGLKSIFIINGSPIVVRALDTFTVEFALPARFAPFMRSLGTSIMPRHALEESVKNNSFNEMWGINTEPRDIICSGPFKLKRYMPGDRIILERNQYYWKQDDEKNSLPYLDQLYFVIIQSPDLTLLKFKSGEIDMYGMRGIDYPWLMRLSEKTDWFTIYDRGPSLSKLFIKFNQNNGIDEKNQKPYLDPLKQKWFQNTAFRQAVAHAINKENIIDLLYNGLAIPHHSVMSPSSGYFYTDAVSTYAYSIEKARAILYREGFIDRDNDGICEDSMGNPVVFNFYISAGNAQATELANLIRKDLARIGLKANLIQIEFNALVNKLTFSYGWDMVMIGLTGGIEPHFGANVWLSSSPLHMWFPRQTVPRTDWEARIDEIFKLGVNELDRTKRKALYDEWQKIVSEEVPVVYTVIPTQYTAVNKRVKNVKPTPLGGILHNIEELYIEKIKA